MELEAGNNSSLMEEDKEKLEEMEIELCHKKKSFKIWGALQLPNKKSAKKTSPKFCSSNSNQTKNTNGTNEDQDTSSDPETDEAPDENSDVLLKRDQNIKENKAVVRTNSAFFDGINSQENKEMRSYDTCNSNCLFLFYRTYFSFLTQVN